MDVPAIRFDALTKYYGQVVGVEQLSLEVPRGEIFGLLGANGAGKTTTIRMLLDLLRPTSGSAAVLGFDTRRQSLEVRARVGYLPGEMPIYPEMTGRGYLAYLAKVGGVPVEPRRLDALLRRFNVSDVDLRRKMRDYSHGMKRKLGIVQALMGDAPVLILDEPTSGLDPLMIDAFAETMDDIAREGRTTVFVSSHILSEVERICQRIGLVRRGTLAAVRTLEELRAAAPRRVTVTFAEAVGTGSVASPSWTLVASESHRWIVDVEGPLGPLMVSLASLPVADMHVESFTLDDAILRLMGEERVEERG